MRTSTQKIPQIQQTESSKTAARTMISVPTNSIVALAACLSAFALPATSTTPRIASSFVDNTHRIERQYVTESQARDLLHNLVYRGVPGDNDTFPKESLKVIGDAGDSNVEQHHIADYAAAMQNFVTPKYHQASQTQNSLIYYIEQLGDEAKYRSEEMIQEVAPNSVLEDGGTVHLYMSAPGAAALGNHTDTTDIVVVQLDGEKEWLLCSEPEEKHAVRDASSMFSKKLDSCSTYSGIEINTLECERSILRPGDALFLPRRVVHSARALSDNFSAHLTFGFNEDEFCWEHGQSSTKRRGLTIDLDEFVDDLFCDSSCDRYCDDGCDKHCDDSCDKGFLFFYSSCDKKCDYGCDRECDASCDSSCD